MWSPPRAEPGIARSAYDRRVTSALLQKYLEQWALRPEGEAIRGNNAYVQPVRTSDDTTAMLRFAPATEADEVLALTLWDGDGAVRLFNQDSADGVMLLERLDHTRNLDALPIEDAANVAGRLRARLSRPAPPGIGTLEAQAKRWIAELQNAHGLPQILTDQAIGICRELGPGSNKYLVNEDQHYHNVLAGRREPWLVIDPRVIAGDREHGLATLIWGRLGESSTRRILDILIDAEALDAEKARAWTFVGAMTKWASSPRPEVARNCATIAYDLC